MDSCTILIVDDEGLTRRALIKGIHWDALGISRILEAGSAAAARKLLCEEQPDLALIDIEMPGEDGISLLSWIREEISQAMPCAFLTCHASFDYAQRANHLGAFDYLLKPIEYARVEELILRMVGRRSLQKENAQMQAYGRQWLAERESACRKHEKTAPSTEDLVKETVLYIRSHLSEKLSLAGLAGGIGLNPNYFNKVFKSVTGETVNQFIIREKMALAAQLLLQGKLKSYAIAESLGYDNYANFVNMFKKTYGVPPHGYTGNGTPLPPA